VSYHYDRVSPFALDSRKELIEYGPVRAAHDIAEPSLVVELGNMENGLVFRSARNVYSMMATLAVPLLRLHLGNRCQRGKENPERIKEREGIASVPRPQGRIIWVHAASVGESISVLPLIDRLLAHEPDIHVLLTTGTLTSAALMKERLPERAVHQFAPLDIQHWIDRFLDHWKPSVVVWLESEFWPTTLCAVKEHHIPLVLLNGRISPSSYRRWRKHHWFISAILSRFDVCLAQSSEDARYIADLGGKNVMHLGNLKLAAPALPADDHSLTLLQEHVHDRPRWLLSSSHPGEENIALKIHQDLSRRFPDLLTVIVPRHPERGPGIAENSQAMGLDTRLRSAGEQPGEDTAIYVADTVGELGLFYRLCPIVLMGKSMIEPGGGQNPYEPANLGCAVIFGPNMDNFVELSRDMLNAGAASQVADQDELRDSLIALLGSPDLLGTKAAAAQDFCTRSASILDNTLGVIIDQMEGNG